jgi:hypothetical protein
MPETKTHEEKQGVEEPVVEPGSESGGAGNEKPGRRVHGKSFIYLNLEDADKELRLIDHQAKRMSREGFARALGHPEPKGRFLQKLNALQEYKLVEDDPEYVIMTELAVEMLYGASPQAQARARVQAFLSYELFHRMFVECPKNQDHDLSYLLGFVKAKLNIVNEVEMFIKRFLESAHFAGLLEGEPDPKAKTIKLRPALAAPSNGEAVQENPSEASGGQWVVVSLNEEAAMLDGLGLTQYQGRCGISQKSSGDVAINVADGKITIEVRRPTRVVITPNNVLTDITEIIKALQSKGFKA